MHLTKLLLLQACPSFQNVQSLCLLSLASPPVQTPSWHGANERPALCRGGTQGCPVAAYKSGYLARQGRTLFSCPSNGALLQLCVLRQEGPILYVLLCSRESGRRSQETPGSHIIAGLHAVYHPSHSLVLTACLGTLLNMCLVSLLNGECRKQTQWSLGEAGRLLASTPLPLAGRAGADHPLIP